jgi:hypothetical protein
MLQISLETLHTLANLSASFLLLVAFLILTAVIVVLYLLWRGIRMARAQVAILAPQVLSYTLEAQTGTHGAAEELVSPQIRAISLWVGLQAGAQTLLTGMPRRRGG